MISSKFICNNCEKELNLEEQQTGFYSATMTPSTIARFEGCIQYTPSCNSSLDAHFCSKGCFLAFLSKII